MNTGRKTKAQLVKELEALRKINATIGTLPGLDAVLQRIIGEIVPLFAAQAASVILFDYATQEAEITTAYGMQTPQGKPLRYPWRDTLSGWIVEHKRPLRLSRPIKNDWPTSAKLAAQLGGSLEAISVLLVPLWQNGAVIGCLEVVWDPRRDIPDGDEQLLETIATQVTIALANARLYQEKELALQAAKENEERHRDLVDNSGGLICTHDLGGVLLSANPAAARKLGYQPHELIGRQFAELMAPSVRHLFPAYLAQVQQETSARGLLRIMTKAGEERVLAFHNILRVEPGRDPYVIAHAQDITERVRAESALRASEEKFRQMAENIRQMFWIVDLKTDQFIYVSPAYEEIWGRPCQSLYEQPRSWQQNIHPEDQERVRTLLVVQRPEKYDLEFRIIRPDGALRWVWVRGFLVQNKRGELYRRVGIIEDITERKQAEEALRESEERTRSIIEAALDAVISIDENGQIIGWNPQAERVFGWSRQEVTGHRLMDMIIPVRYRDAHQHGLQRFMQTGAGNILNKRIEVPALRRDGTEFPVELAILPVRRKERWTFTAFVRDISEQKRAETRLRDSERRLRLMVEHLPAGAVYNEGETIFFNKAVERITGYSNAEIPTIDQWFHRLYGAKADRMRRRHEEGRRTNFPVSLVVSLTRKDGEIRFVEFAAYRSESSEVWLLYDVTERKQAEEALREGEERYRIISQSISDCAFSYRIDSESSFVLEWVTESFAKISGYDVREFFTRPNPWSLVVHPEDLAPLSQVFRTLVPGVPAVHDYRMIRKDGEVRWLRGYFHLFYDSDGQPVRMYGAAQDITDRKRAEEALRQSEARYRIVSQCISDYAFSLRIEADGTPFLEWLTDSFTKVTGYPTENFFGKPNPGARYIHPEDLGRVYETIRQLPSNVPTTYEFRIIPGDGETRWVRSHVYAVRGEKGDVTYLYGAAQDVTERKRAEEALQYQLAFEQLIASVSKDFIELAPEEIDGGILRALKTIGEFSGVDRSYLFSFSENFAVMHNTHEWCAPGIEPAIDRMRRVPTNILPWAGEQLRNSRMVHISRASELPPEARTERERMQTQGIRSVLNVPIVLGKTLVGFLGFDSLRAEKHWAEESITLLRVVGEIIANALERKRAAERQQQLQAQLLQTQKLEAIGTLANGIAHDFNNILAAVMGYTELVTDDVPDDSLARRNLEEVLTASRRARKLVQQLLTFSRPSRQDRRPVQLHEIVEDTLTLLRASLPKNIDIHFTRHHPMDTILADPTQIEQMVMNLCVNAAHAIGEHDGAIGIGIDLVDKDHTSDLVHSDVPGQSFYCLTVKDTGYGMTPAMLKHIFEPFFTTKPVGQGSGMGLAIVHGIVTGHGGSIAVESQLGQGTTFRVYFPSFRETVMADETAMVSADQEVPV